MNHPIEKRPLGKTGDSVTVIAFGGVIVTNSTRGEAERWVSKAFDRGVTYFDVAPFYGNAQERLGPALEPYRDECFLACKTLMRDADGAARELDESLRLLKTDRIDLYQLHSLMDVEKDVDVAFGPRGAMEAVLRAKQAGKIRHIGFSAHSEEAAMAAMDRFEFDSIMFPLSYVTWHKGEFGPAVFERARKNEMGIIALKACAKEKWPREMRKDPERPWRKLWYQPLEERRLIELGLRFALGLPVTAAIPPGDWRLFEIALDLAESGALSAPVDEDELRPLRDLAERADVLFSAAQR